MVPIVVENEAEFTGLVQNKFQVNNSALHVSVSR